MIASAFPALLAADLSRTRWQLARLRWLMLAAGLVALAVAAYAGLQLPWLLLGQAGLTLAVLNAVLARLPLSDATAVAAGLLADWLVLTEVLALTGGAANPLASLYLPPVLLAALLLRPWQAWTLAGASLLAYAALFVWHLPWPLAGKDAAYAFRLHLIGMWFTFALSVVLLTLFVSMLAHRLGRREAALAAARAAQSRDEQLVAVGVQAAMAAHTLSTPLNTLTLLCEDWQHTLPATHPLAGDLLLMQQQLAQCRAALQRLKAGAEPHAEALPVADALSVQLQAWQAGQPGVRLIREGLLQGGPVLALDARFWPAFFNLLNNAAEAGGGEVRLSLSIHGHHLLWQIHNPQGSLRPDQLVRAGLAPLGSDKTAGLGLGVMLSHATLSQLGGELRLDNDPQGGVRASIRLPIPQEAA